MTVAIGSTTVAALMDFSKGKPGETFFLRRLDEKLSHDRQCVLHTLYGECTQPV